jgi:Fe/S biogenesis protein NfuA
MVEVIIIMTIVVQLLSENHNGGLQMLPNHELEVTESAISKVLDVMKSEDLPLENTLLRITIRGRIEGNYDYGLGLDERKDPIRHVNDSFFNLGNFDLVIDDKSLEKMDGATIDYVEDLNNEGFKIENPNKPVETQIEAGVRDLLDSTVNPQIASHGGRIEVVRVDNGVLYIEMHGGCQGCSSSKYTLQYGVEQKILETFPDITSIEDVTDHGAGENPYYA